ncbi:tyrosine-type recombinase/integrase [Sulfurovum mangrovi]|uniref:tyrosine-type recombinase/integrase n=1 Tax=Sulfurovum mangrovi TaxID=2893889 RepID=UPI001E38E6AE|nr:site-specific integrase [Sulfurovum mangrovi]UFH60480.1 site-specific integrase [Sulfurovum mangrovi]
MSRIKSKKYTGVYLNQLVDGDISYSITYKDNTGKLIRYTVGKKSNGITETFAYNQRATFINKIKHGVDPQEHRKKKHITTLDNLADVYFKDKAHENKANTKQEGRYNLHIKPSLGSKDINSITKADITNLQKALKAKMKAPKTINGIIQLLSAIINHSIKEKDLKLINPCTGVKKLKTDDKRERYLTLDEVKKLTNEIKDDDVLYHFVKLALMTGARLEGVLNIQKKDIKLDTNSVTIKDLKSGGTYTGFYDDEYKQVLEVHIKSLKANDYVVGGSEEKTASRTIQRHLKKILDRLFNKGLEIRDFKNRVVIHTLRHTFASQLAIAGVPILTIKNLMNHADIAQTMRYAKLAPDQGIEAVKGLYR